MTTETVLTDARIMEMAEDGVFLGNVKEITRAIEQAVLQSPEIQALRKDAERLDWMANVAHCADWVEDEPTKRVIRADDGAEFQGDTWRAAIDAAMEKQQ